MEQAWVAVDRYVEDKLVPTDEALEAALLANAAAGLPSHDVPPPQGRLLHLLARMCDARPGSACATDPSCPRGTASPRTERSAVHPAIHGEARTPIIM